MRLTDLAARIAPDGDYDYDIAPYYVDRHYDYPRFVCYDCHAYASYNEWDPYRASCTRYRVVVRDDPRFYPYRYGGRNVVADRPAHPGPRFVFRDADPRRPALSRASPTAAAATTTPAAPARTWAVGVGARAPTAFPPHPRPRADARALAGAPDDRRAAAGGAAAGAGARARRQRARVAQGLRPATAAPQSTGEPELRRRRP